MLLKTKKNENGNENEYLKTYPFITSSPHSLIPSSLQNSLFNDSYCLSHLLSIDT